LCGRPTCGAENITETNEGNTCQNSNDGNYDEKFDKGKTSFSMGFFHIIMQMLFRGSGLDTRPTN